VVSAGGQTPRFAYTIGVSESIGVELILAGAIFYMKDDLVTIINEILAKMKAQPDCEVFEVDGQGSFTLREVHSSWAQELLLGALDYYQNAIIECFRLFPTRLTGPSM